MARENTTEYILLGLLSHEELSGYDLKKRIDLSIRRFWDAGYGQIYPALRRLEREGSVSARAEPSGKGPERILYSITAAGRGKLSDWLAEPGDREYVRYEVLLKLFFGNLRGGEANLESIEAFRRRHTADLDRILSFKSDLERALDQDPDHLYFYLTVLFGEKVYRAYLDWAGEAVRLIQGQNRKEPSDEAPKGP